MQNIEDIIAKGAYYKIRNNTISEPTIFGTIEMYIKRPLTETEKARIREYAEKIRSGELSYDEYRSLYKSKISRIR